MSKSGAHKINVAKKIDKGRLGEQIRNYQLINVRGDLLFEDINQNMDKDKKYLRLVEDKFVLCSFNDASNVADISLADLVEHFSATIYE